MDSDFSETIVMSRSSGVTHIMVGLATVFFFMYRIILLQWKLKDITHNYFIIVRNLSIKGVYNFCTKRK